MAKFFFKFKKPYFWPIFYTNFHGQLDGYQSHIYDPHSQQISQSLCSMPPYWANGGSVDVFLGMVNIVLVLWGVGAILGNGYEIQGQNYIALKAGFHYRNLILITFQLSHLNLLRMSLGGGGLFGPVTSTNVRISPQNFLPFSFIPFATLLKTSRLYLVPVPNH